MRASAFSDTAERVWIPHSSSRPSAGCENALVGILARNRVREFVEVPNLHEDPLVRTGPFPVPKETMQEITAG